jgi:uncharacterized protein YbcI
MSETVYRGGGGQLNADVSQAVVRIYREHLGRGATKARTFHRGNVIVTILEDTLTQAERNLATRGKLDAVLHMRHEFQVTMREDLSVEVERLSGRLVIAFLSDNHFDPDVAAEIFVLDRPVDGEEHPQPD